MVTLTWRVPLGHIVAGLVLVSVCSPTFAAAGIDGTKPLLCAPVDSIQCAQGAQCLRGEGEVINLPSFFKADPEGKMLSGIQGDERSSPIRHAMTADGALVMQGDQNGRAWSMVVSLQTGDMTLTASADRGAYVVFGVCTPL